MAQHSNYAKDRDLMMEAYSSVQGTIPHTQSTAPARLYNEGHCSDEEKITKVELGGEVFEIGSPDPKEGGIIVEIEKFSNGYMISVGEYNSPEDYVNDPDSATGGYGYALTLDGQPMDEDDLEDGLGHSEDNEHVPAEDSSCASNEEGPSDEFFEMLDDVSMEVGSESYEAIVNGLEAKLGRKLTEREAEEAHQMAQEDEDAEGKHSPVQTVTAAIDQLAATLQGDERLAAYEDLRAYLNASLGRSENEEGHHHSGSDDGECDECGGDGCDVCNGTGEQDEEEIVAENYTAQYLLK